VKSWHACAALPSNNSTGTRFTQHALLFPEDDKRDHSTLQPQLKTPICLDESILSADHARAGIELGACRIINKAARVSGLFEAKQVHDLCRERGVPV
jgi:O-succinylbenzoate synthase